MDAEIKAIADRMRRHLKAIESETTFRDSPYFAERCLGKWDRDIIDEDDGALSRAFLAEHPADDDESVTEEWLLSVGFDGDWVMLRAGERLESPEFCLSFHGIEKGDGKKRAWLLTLDPVKTVSVEFPETRGQVRLMCRALGITLKEGTQLCG